MRFGRLRFGSITIDGMTYAHDVIIDRGKVRKRKKKPSQKFREEFGHTPVSVEEKLPWKCHRLVMPRFVIHAKMCAGASRVIR